MKFIGKICPYCKSEFKENDDVVICSVCEMPHHKECWIENKACTTFGCTGTIMGDDNNNNRLFCEKCGLVHTADEEICAACGNVFIKARELQPQYAYNLGQQQSSDYYQSPYVSQTSSVSYSNPNNNYNKYNEINIDVDMQIFVDKNQHYYAKKFQKFNLTNSKVSWNWAIAFVGAYWAVYRKMYKIVMIYIGVYILGKLIPHISTILNLTMFLFMGMYGNYLYNRHVEKHVQIAKNMDAYEKQNYLITKGGTSRGAVWALIGIMMLMGIILSLITNPYL